jgi:hypothetical protein
MDSQVIAITVLDSPEGVPESRVRRCQVTDEGFYQTAVQTIDLEDRRRDTRYLVQREASVTLPAGTCRGVMVNLSQSGFALQIDGPIAVGATVRVDFEESKLEGIVRHCHPTEDGYLVGVSLLSTNP